MSSAGVREVEDDLGSPVMVGERPQRLVSLVPNLSEVLWWWHLAGSLVAVTEYCVAPPRAFDDAVRVRGTKNPDVAAIVELGPDLVIANEEENRAIDVQRLRDAGLAVYVTKVRSVHGAAEALARLGDVLGRPDAGVGLRQSILRALEQRRPPEAQLAAACAIWRDGARRGAEETWWLVGGASFAGDLLRRCGFDALPGDDERYPRFTLDELEARDPDVVLLPDEPYAFTVDDARPFDTWRARVRHLDGTALSWWGPRTPHAIEGLTGLARQLSRPRRRRVRRD